MEYQPIKDIESKVGSPFYIMSPEVYEENVKAFAAAFRKRYEKLIVGYSFKTNYVPALCLRARQLGCYAEVVSGMEMDLALSLGFENIIFNGPIKRDEALIRAIKRGAIINIDAEYEVDFICKYHLEHPELEIKAGIRLNVMLTDENGNSAVQNGLRCGRFGFPHDMLSRNIQKLRESGIKIISVHGHTSSSDISMISLELRSCILFNRCGAISINRGIKSLPQVT